MAENMHTDAICIYVEHLKRKQLSVAHFNWREGPTDEAYILHLNPSTTLELDKHFPVRPSLVRLKDNAQHAEKEALRTYVGNDIVAALQAAPRLGSVALISTLNLENRLAFARLQYASHDSPRELRLGCLAMLQEHARAPFRHAERSLSVDEYDDGEVRPPAA